MFNGKKITLTLAECILIVSLGVLLLIGITGGFSVTLGPLTLKAHRLKNPLIFLMGALVIRKILTGRFAHGLACVAFVRRFSDRLTITFVESYRFRKQVLWMLFLLGMLSAGILLSFYSFSLKRGLIGRYYNNPEWAGSPIITTHSRSIGLQRMTRQIPRVNYSIEWTGVICIPVSGTYQFTLGSDDGSLFYLNKQLIVDNGGYHGFRERSGKITLEEGFYPISIRYMQGEGSAMFRVSWTRPGKRQARLSHVFLFPEKPGETAYFIDRLLSNGVTGFKLIWLICLVTGIVIFLSSRRIILPLLKNSLLGKVYSKLVGWLLEDEADKPAFSFLPENFYPVPRSLFLIVIGSFLLNAWGISWGLPSFYGWIADELTPTVMQETIRTGFSQGWFSKYPPFHYYLLAITYIPFFILHQLRIIDMQSFQIYTILFYLSRFISVLMGTAIVFITYLCGCEIYTKRASLFAALITALMPSFLYYSKNANLDVPYMFWFVLSLLWYIRILKYHRIADYLLFSITATISVCTKDQAYGFYVLTPIGIVLAHYLSERKHYTSAKIIHSLFNRKTLLSLLSAVVVFIVIHNIPFNLDGFLNHVTLISGPASKPYRIYENTVAGHIRMLGQDLKHLRFSFGWPVFLSCISGVVMACFQKKKNVLLFWILIPGISYYLFFMHIILYNYVRFFMPICILLAFFGGQCFSDFLDSTRRFYHAKIIVVSSIFLYTFFYAASVDILMAEDSRYYVETWMEQNIDENSSIGLVSFLEFLPRVTKFTRTIPISELSLGDIERFKPDYLVVNSNIKFRREKFYTRLHNEELGYTLLLRYRSTAKWVLLNYEDIIKNGKRDIFTSLDKINPEIEIFKRIVDPDQQ